MSTIRATEKMFFQKTLVLALLYKNILNKKLLQ